MNLFYRAQNLTNPSQYKLMLRSMDWEQYSYKHNMVSYALSPTSVGSFLPRETRYSVVEKECLAVKWALDSFKYYLLGRKFTLETDHRALTWLGRMKDTNSRITRWFLAMQQFNFEVLYRKGLQNCTADFLSRTPQEVSKGRGRRCHGVTPWPCTDYGARSLFFTHIHTQHTLIWTFMMLGSHRRLCVICVRLWCVMSSVKVRTCFVCIV